MIIAVEGADCTGKGEVCYRLAKFLNAILYKTPPEQMRVEQDRINATASDADHYDYFIRVVRAASEEIATLARKRNIVVDRYWMTTIVYHRAMGLPAKLEDIGKIVMPDVTVYLTVSPEAQDQRMKNRGMSPGDQRMLGRQHLIRQRYEEVIANHGNVVRVDTSNITPEEAVNSVVSSLHLRGAS